jgi:hypothetical protein
VTKELSVDHRLDDRDENGHVGLLNEELDPSALWSRARS